MDLHNILSSFHLFAQGFNFDRRYHCFSFNELKKQMRGKIDDINVLLDGLYKQKKFTVNRAQLYDGFFARIIIYNVNSVWFKRIVNNIAGLTS